MDQDKVQSKYKLNIPEFTVHEQGYPGANSKRLSFRKIGRLHGLSMTGFNTIRYVI